MKLLLINRLVICLSTIIIAGCGDSSGSDIRYVALGASDATGVGADPITSGYVFVIEDRLEDMGKETALTNLGIPGAEIIQLRQIELPVAVEVEPELVTIFTGANDIIGGDSPDSFEDDLKEILEELTEETGAFIAIATIPDLTQLPRFVEDPDRDVTADRLAQFNSAIIRQAQNFQVAIVDLRDLAVGGSLTDSDGFHPNNEGHRLLAQRFLDVIEPQFF